MSQVKKKIYSTALGIKIKKEHIAYDPFKVPYKTINGKSISLGDFIKDDWYIPTSMKIKDQPVHF